MYSQLQVSLFDSRICISNLIVEKNKSSNPYLDLLDEIVHMFWLKIKFIAKWKSFDSMGKTYSVLCFWHNVSSPNCVAYIKYVWAGKSLTSKNYGRM